MNGTRVLAYDLLCSETYVLWPLRSSTMQPYPNHVINARVRYVGKTLAYSQR